MSTIAPQTATIVQTKFRRFRANVVGATKDFLYVIPILFPEGPDWASLNASKIEIEEVEIQMKPYYNFATLAGADKGVVSGDFPVYMNFYTGNTAGEPELKDFSKYILSGKYVMGSATTGVKARYGALHYKTVLSESVEDKESTELSDLIANKENTDRTIDDFNLASKKIILQKGRVVICIRKDDFMLKTDEVVTEENPDGGNGSGNEAIMRHLMSKGKPVVVEKKVEKKVEKEVPRKKARRNPGPEPEPEPEPEPQPTPVDDGITYCEEPVIIDDGNGKSHKELLIDLPFWLITTFYIKYWRNA